MQSFQSYAKGLFFSLLLICLPSALQAQKISETELADLIKSAEGGNVMSAAVLGNYYLINHPEKADETKKWLTLAAEKGNAEAQFGLATMYKLGRGVPTNMVECVNWLQ